MKNKIINWVAFFSALSALVLTGCTKLLDKHPLPRLTPGENDSSISQATAENLMQGVYGAFKGAGSAPE